MTKADMKKKMAEVIKNETGLTAPLKDITITDHVVYTHGETYIECEVNGHIYRWDSYTLDHIAPWNMA